MKFIFYIIDLEEGSVQGTNNVEALDDFLENDQYTIIHAQATGVWWLGSRKENEVEKLEEPEDEDEPADEC